MQHVYAAGLAVCIGSCNLNVNSTHDDLPKLAHAVMLCKILNRKPHICQTADETTRSQQFYLITPFTSLKDLT
jgi:hypothetical protein